MGTISPNCLTISRLVPSTVVHARPNESVPPTAVKTIPMNGSMRRVRRSSPFSIGTSPMLESSKKTPAAKNGRPKTPRQPPPSRI
jgi:hypothetical protein